MDLTVPSAALLPADGDTITVLVGTGLLVLVSILFALLLLTRRHQKRELREMVVVLEDLRSGHLRRRLDVDPRSSMALMSDAVNRLAQDLTVQWGDAERAKEQLRAFLDAARDVGVISTSSRREGDQISRAATRCSLRPPFVSGDGKPM